jgi:hypothetical protein
MMQQWVIFVKQINAKRQIIDLQGDRIFVQANGG